MESAARAAGSPLRLSGSVLRYPIPTAASGGSERGGELRNCCFPTLQMTLRLLGTGDGNDPSPVAL